MLSLFLLLSSRMAVTDGVGYVRYSFNIHIINNETTPGGSFAITFTVQNNMNVFNLKVDVTPRNASFNYTTSSPLSFILSPHEARSVNVYLHVPEYISNQTVWVCFNSTWNYTSMTIIGNHPLSTETHDVDVEYEGYVLPESGNAGSSSAPEIAPDTNNTQEANAERKLILVLAASFTAVLLAVLFLVRTSARKGIGPP